jgi:hypothetical protein
MNTEKLEKLKKSLDNKFIPDNMKDKIREEIKKLESEIKTDDNITPAEVKEEIKEIEEKVEEALEVAEKKEEQAEAKAEEKKEKAPRKPREKKDSQSETKTQKAKKKSVFSIAKEIRKDGESWEDAKKRATKMMKSETTETKKKVRTETDKLLAMVRRNKEYKKLAGTSNLSKDASRRALPRGKRVSADGNVYYENRANRVDVGGFKSAYLENGGGIEKYRVSEGIDHYNNKPLYRVEDMSEDGEYVGEWHAKREDAVEELKDLIGSYKNGGVILDGVKIEVYKGFHGLKAENYFDNINGYDWNIVTMKRHSGELVSSAKAGKTTKSDEDVEMFTFDWDSPNIKLVSSRPSKVTEKVIEIQHSQALQIFKEKMEQGNYADGGSIIGTPETPLDRGLGMNYTTLVGETGAMSSGEMFAGGGGVWTKKQREQVAKLDDDFEKAVEKAGIERNSKEASNLWRSGGFQKRMRAIFGKEDEKYSKGVYVETLDEKVDLTDDGKPRVKKTQEGKKMSEAEWMEKYNDSMEARTYAEGGSLGNHGLKQGDQILKTMSGGVQKVKTKSGDIVYVNLANGYRGDVPPLPFDAGGRLKSAIMRDRNNVNYSEDYEVRYSKDKPHRSGYTKPKMSRTQFEDESFEFFDKGGRTRERKFVNYGQDYEVRYAKDKPKRRGYGYAEGGVTKNYINRKDLNTITIKKGDQKLTYKVSDVYNGAYKLEDGGNLEKTAFYVSKRNVVKVQTKDGKDVKVANGYWIKKNAKPIHTSKFDNGGEIRHEDYDDVIDMWDKLSISQRKNLLDSQEDLEEYGNHSEIAEDDWDELDDYVTDVLENHFKSKMYAGGGKTTFKEKATAIAKNFEGKKVEPKYEKEYGKTYDKAEAKEVGNKIAGSQKAKYDSKMSGGGSTTKRGGAMVLAKQIRKEGESWQSALKRANEQLSKK